MDIKFHCSEHIDFPKANQYVRAFSFTEYSVPPHNHDFYEMNIVLGGTGVHQIENASFTVKKGDVFVIPPMTVHAYHSTEHLEVYHILLKKDFVRENASEAADMPGFLQLVEIAPFLNQNSTEAMFLHLTQKQIIELQSDLKFIEAKGAFDNEQFFPLQNHTAWKIIYYLAFLLYEQTASEKKSKRASYRQQILDTLEYLHHNFSEKITVADLSERVFLSRSTFLRSFQAICGCSPIDYLNQYRIKKAIELLEISAMSKTEIAHSCGFYDLSHMERSIKSGNERK